MFSLFTGIVECIGRVGLAYPLTLIPFLGSYGVFYATGLTWLLNGLFSLVRYKKGKWKTINLVKLNNEPADIEESAQADSYA